MNLNSWAMISKAHFLIAIFNRPFHGAAVVVTSKTPFCCFLGELLSALSNICLLNCVLFVRSFALRTFWVFILLPVIQLLFGS